METRYKRELNHNYLIIAMEEEDCNYQLKMLLGNSIEGLLKVWMKQVDGRREFYYEISSKQPFSRLLERKRLSYEEVKDFILALTAVLRRVEEYLLPAKQLILDPEYIYVEPDEFQFYFCCLPGYEEGGPGTVQELMRYLLDRVDYQEPEAVTLIYRLYQETVKDNFKMDTLAGLLYKKEQRVEKKARQIGVTEEYEEPNGNQSSKKQAMTVKTNCDKPSSRKEKLLLWICLGVTGIIGLCALAWPVVFWKERWLAMVKANWLLTLAAQLCITAAFAWLYWCIWREWRQDKKGWNHWDLEGEDRDSQGDSNDIEGRIGGEQPDARKEEREERTSVFENSADWEEAEEEPIQWIGGTTLLIQDQERGSVRRLAPLGELGEEVEISCFPFIIGKSSGLADLALPYTAVSRMHVRIDRKPDGYLITDLNSTNGTRVGEQRLEANEAVALQVGEEIWIANVGFRFL